MAIFGVGSSYGTRDVTSDFLAQGVACIGWSEADAPPLYNLLRRVTIGDLIYIKSNSQGRLFIKAVGVVVDNKIKTASTGNLGGCIEVRWVWNGRDIVGRIDDKFNIRSNTLYEEMNQEVQSRVVSHLLNAIP